MAVGDWVALGALSVLWGSGAYFNEVAVRGLGPLTISLVRVALAALLLGAALRSRGESLRIAPHEAMPLALVGMAGTTLPFGLIAWGAQDIASGLAERITVMDVVGIVLIETGMAMVDGRVRLPGRARPAPRRGRR